MESGGKCLRERFSMYASLIPTGQSNRQTSLTNCYRRHENVKKRSYEQLVRKIELAFFTFLVLSATGGMHQKNHLLQAPRFKSSVKAWSILFSHPHLATNWNHFLTTKICHPKHQSFLVQQWTLSQNSTSHWPCSFGAADRWLQKSNSQNIFIVGFPCIQCTHFSH